MNFFNICRIGIPIVKHISKIVGIHWEVSGKEILAKDFPCVIICNHQSAWDFMCNTNLEKVKFIQKMVT